MNKVDLSVEVVKRIGGSKKEASKYIDAVLDGILEGMKNDGKATFANFGTFSSQLKKAHTARNPRTGDPVEVPDRYHPKFSFANSVREYLNS